MDNLPDEILIQIFSFFCMKTRYTFMQVCRRWCNLILDTPKLNSFFIIKKREDFDFLNNWSKSHEVKTLIISMEVDLLNTLFEQLEKICPFLESLSIMMANLLSERHVYRLNKCFPHLRHLDVFLTSHFISPYFLSILKNLKSVVLNNKIDDTTLKIIAESCPNLKELHMYGNVQYYPLSQLQNILSLRFNQLTKLSLRCYELDDKTCQLLAQCSNIQHLYMYHCWLLTDTGLLSLTTFRYLITLHLTGPRLVTQKGMENFIRTINMENITELNLSCSTFNDRHAYYLSKKKINLRTLELWNCIHLTDVGISHIITALKKLDTLDLNMSLSYNVLRKIVFDTDIFHLRYDNTKTKIADITELLTHRKLEICSAVIYNEYYFRGNSEGFRANFLCYSYHFRFPE